jgi:hypothetical protein
MFLISLTNIIKGDSAVIVKNSPSDLILYFATKGGGKKATAKDNSCLLER